MITTNLDTTSLLAKYCDLDDQGNYSPTQLNHIKCQEFYTELNLIKQQIFSHINSSKIEFEILDCWINVYSHGDFNEVHNHDSDEYNSKCEYTGILILDCGTNENLIIYNEQNESENFHITPGNLYIIPNNVLHGLDTVKDKVIALMFMIKQ